MKTRAYLVMRSVFVKGKEFPVFDGYMLTSSPSWDLTHTGCLYSTVLSIPGKSYQDASDRFHELIYSTETEFYRSLRPWFSKTEQGHMNKMDLFDRVKKAQNEG